MNFRRGYLIAFLLISVVWSLSSFRQHPWQKPPGWPEPIYDFRMHPLESGKVYLGRLLFYDPILSLDSSVSCASCHSPYNAFAHTDHALSHGIGDSIGRRNAPALQLLAWQSAFMWDGRFATLDEQTIFPITHTGEMGEELDHVLVKVNRKIDYRKLVAGAYGDSTLTVPRLQESIRQFLLTLVSSESKYDSVMRKEQSFTLQEQKGYSLFRKHCNSCHAEPLFSDFSYEKNGLSPDPKLQDSGRMEITRNTEDLLRFKTPSLRNLRYSAPYMHDGRFRTLREVIAHYTGVAGTEALKGSRLGKRIILSENEKTDLLAFLLTLNDSKFIFDPAHGFPREVLH